MTAAPSDLLQLCWGKAASEEQGVYHPATLHMLDVAAVALELLTLPGSTRLRAALCSDLEPAQVALLVACHDLGKLSPGFQTKRPDLAAGLASLGLEFHHQARTDHGRVGYVTLPGHLVEWKASPTAAAVSAAAVCAHHGSRPVHEALSRRRHGGDAWHAVRTACVGALAHALEVEELEALVKAPDAWAARLAGLTSVADWIGSSVEFFPYAPAAEPTVAYLERARDRARAALETIGWSRWQGASVRDRFEDLFPTYSPNTIQSAVDRQMSGADLPELLIVEAPTGLGKSEAAFLATARWLARDSLAGAYVALPTQATSNQMFDRVQTFLDHLAPDDTANLHLVHGAAAQQESYRSLRLRSIDEPGNAFPSVVADQWFQTSRRALLSPFAVGTVDQAMLAALQARHFFVRLFALADKVVIIDEVHAYDAFMSRILGRLLGWLRALGSRVVLLSATLPSSRRAELIEAWGAQHAACPPATAYPRITAVGPSGAVEVTQTPPPAPCSVALTWVSADAASAQVAQLVQEGAQVAFVCNTVAGAQRAFQALAAAGVSDTDRTLFHARFPLEDRQRIETAVLRRFDRSGARQTGHVVVATQVIEQSLDLDFDAMVTELAPVDLLIQRAGRLHRHERAARPRGAETPNLRIIRPTGAPGAPQFGASSFVYHPHILLRTWAALRARERWLAPADIPELVAEVYGESVCPPSDLVEPWTTSRHDLERMVALAWRKPTDTLIPPPNKVDSFFDDLHLALSDELDGDLPPGLHVRTRDIGASVRLLCVGIGPNDDTIRTGPHGGSVVALGARPAPALVRQLLLRSVVVTHRRWLPMLREHARLPPAWQGTSQLRGCLLLPFGPDGRCAVQALDLVLDPELGLVLPAPHLDAR